MRRWAMAAPSARATTGARAWACASGTGGTALRAGSLMDPTSAPGCRDGPGRALTDDLGADRAHRPPPQAGSLLQRGTGRLCSDLLQGARGGNAQRVAGRGWKPEAAHQDGAQPRHRLVAPEGPERRQGVLEATVATPEQIDLLGHFQEGADRP